MRHTSQESQAALQAAEAYQNYLVPAMFEPWARVLVEQVALRPGEHVLDVACGTGAVVRAAAAIVGSEGAVSGLDLNPAMLEVARSVPTPAGTTVSWHHGTALALPFPETSFDAALCQQGLEFFGDPVLGLREMRRVLVPRGRVAVMVMQAIEDHPVHHALNEAIKQHIGTPAFAAPFSMADSEHLRGLLSAAGFERIEIVSEARPVRFPAPERFIALSVMAAAAAVPAFAQMEPAARAALVDAIRHDAASVIKTHTQDDMLVQTMSVYIALGWR